MILGTVVIDEVIMPIHRITLDDGKILLHAHRCDWRNLRINGDISVHAPDGTVIFSAPSIPGDTLTNDHDEGLTITLPIKVSEASRSAHV